MNVEVRHSTCRELLCRTIDLYLSEIARAKPPARRGSNAYASESDSIHRHSIFDILRFWSARTRLVHLAD